MLTNKITNIESASLGTTILGSTRSIEEELHEQQLLNAAENWLNSKGVATRTCPCGSEQYLRHSYDILVDFGRYLEEPANVK